MQERMIEMQELARQVNTIDERYADVQFEHRDYILQGAYALLAQHLIERGEGHRIDDLLRKYSITGTGDNARVQARVSRDNRTERR